MPPVALTVTVELPPLHRIAVLEELAVREGHVFGLSAIKIAPHCLLAEIVADPAPVEPAVALTDHAPPTDSRLVTKLPYNSLRVPGDVAVEN